MSKLEELVQYGWYGTQRALFMTPMMYLSEIISGLHSSQSLKSRAIALGVNFFVAMPYNDWFKPKVYEWLGVNESSPKHKKKMANRIAFAAHQIPLYTGILLASGASAEQIAVALPTGVAVGITISGRFQEFMDQTSAYITKKYNDAKEKINYASKVVKSYAKNLAYATLIAAMTRVSTASTINYVRENNIISNKETMLVMDTCQPEGFFWVRSQDFKPESQQIIIPAQR